MKVDYKMPVNLGNPGEFTVAELADMVIKLTGTKSKIEHKELPKDDPKKRKPDISKAKKLLDWEPKVTLKEGISKAMVWFRSEINK